MPLASICVRSSRAGANRGQSPITLNTVAETRSEGIAYIPLKDSNPSQMFATLTWRRNHVTPQLARVLEISEEVLPTPDLSNFQDDPLIRKYCDDL